MTDPRESPEWAEYERLRGEACAEVLNAEAALDDPGAFTAEERDAAYERAEAAVVALDAFFLRLLAERREPVGYAVMWGEPDNEGSFPIVGRSTLAAANDVFTSPESRAISIVCSLHPVEP